jgi:hypothetical protein
MWRWWLPLWRTPSDTCRDLQLPVPIAGFRGIKPDIEIL